MTLRFIKISATGNDFILIDNRAGIWSAERDRLFFSRLCRHHLSIGADGVILLEPSTRANFRYVHINADGSIAGMCGNGSRAVAWFACHLGIGGDELSFEIGESLYHAQVHGVHVTTRMVPPAAIDLSLDAAAERGMEAGGFIDTGVPHYIIYAGNIAQLDVAREGSFFRHHAAFPQGSNVDFVQIQNPHHLLIRTYERGVEAETLACGTGAVASSLISHLRGRAVSPVRAEFPGGVLDIEFSDDFARITLSGEVTPVYQGELFPDVR